MRIKLIPISHPELDTIEIDTEIFNIGRLEDPFLSYDSELTADLSRHHAKIFTENDQLFVVDQESLNGTTLNDLELGTKPLPVNNGDMLEFAGRLAYKIEFVTPDQDATRLADHPPEMNLTLEPVDKGSGLDILVITGFPFLISKEVGVFASFHKGFASESSRISRRHAYILLENNAFKLVDMSSTNGTFVNSIQIDDDQPTTLKNGDIVSFAGNFFIYIVKLGSENQSDIEATMLRPEDTEITDEHTSIHHNKRDDIEPKTTFVNEPTPFLDILCNEAKNNPDPKDNSEKDKSTGRTKKTSQKKTSFVASFIQQCWSALADEKPKKSKKKAYLIFLTLVCITIVTAYLYLNDNTREIKQLINSGKYADAATLSIEFLRSDPDNTALKDLSTTAILNNIIPGWLERLEEGQYSEAEQALQSAQKTYLTNPEIASSTEILQWAGNMHQFMATRNENDAIVIFEDENKIYALLASWNTNRKQNRKTLAMIARNVPAFKPYYEQVLSDVRSLENDQDLYLQAIDTLKENIMRSLKTGNTQELGNTVTKFEIKYTVITGLDDLKLDIYHYIELNEAVSNKDIESIDTIRKQHQFKTPLFIKYNQQKITEQLPSEKFTEQYSEAIKSWKAGEVETAINLLRPLSESNWGFSAQNKLERYQAVLAEFSDLNKAKGSDKYVDSLFNFHALLELPEDNYFFKMIEPDFQDNKQVAQEKAQKNFDQAQIYWTKYTDNDGIGGLLRLENHVSSTYMTQAENLSAASRNIHYSLQIYKNLHIDAPNDIRKMSLTIDNEIEKQRKWLIDLELILKPETLKKKLDLLITPED